MPPRMENNPHMPTLKPTPTYRIAVRGAVNGQSTLSYHYYSAADGVSTLASMGQLCEDFWALVGPFWTDAVSLDWQVNSIVARRVDLYGQPSGFRTKAQLDAVPIPTVGVGGASCPPQDCVVIKKTTLGVGKRNRGRWYIAGVPEASHTSGVLTAGVADWTAFALILRSGLLSQTVDLVAVHAFWEEFPPTPPAIEGIVVLEGREIFETPFDTTIRTQRRRQLGRGI